MQIALITQAAGHSSLHQSIDPALHQAIACQRVNGGVILVYHAGHPVYAKAFGFRDRELALPVNMNTKFRYASLTKTITTIAVLKLIDRNVLALNDPVTKWIPNFKPKLRDGSQPVITIKSLLTHTSGINYGFQESEDGLYHQMHVSDGLDNQSMSMSENIKRISQVPLLFRPGTHWHYSLSTDVLGLILEKAEKKSLPAILDAEVLKPLHMNDTSFYLNNHSNSATPYMNTPNGIKRMQDIQLVPFDASYIVFSPLRAYNKKAYPSAGAGLIGTANDYMKLLEAIRTHQLGLSDDSMQLLTTNQIGQLNSFADGWGWTAGFAILKNPNLAMSPQAEGTYEWGGVYGNSWWVDPANQLSVVILTNTAFEGMSGRLVTDVKTSIYDWVNQNVYE